MRGCFESRLRIQCMCRDNVCRFCGVEGSLLRINHGCYKSTKLHLHVSGRMTVSKLMKRSECCVGPARPGSYGLIGALVKFKHVWYRENSPNSALQTPCTNYPRGQRGNYPACTTFIDLYTAAARGLIKCGNQRMHSDTCVYW